MKLPNEIQDIIDDVRLKLELEITNETDLLVELKRIERTNDKSHWDVPKETEIEVFDPNLSYEITGYRPIDNVHGLDFNPEWFIQTRKKFEETGKYCDYLPRSKRWDNFWKEEYKRCKYGYTVNGYTITGDNYFFLNFYLLPVVDLNKASGTGTSDGFPTFFASQYTFFHYLQMCRMLHKNAALMKARSIGFSEINASLAANLYTTVKKSKTMITCYTDKFLTNTFDKVTNALTFLNTHADGFFKPRIVNKALEIKSGYQVKIDGLFTDAGWQSSIKGVNGSKPSNIRGDRVDLLIFDEAGTWIDLTTAIVQGQELCEVQGIPRGIQLYGGTGGDFGPPLEGLKQIYYNPKAYKVLPYRHNYTLDGLTIDSGFFIPYFVLSLNPKYMDNRGVCNIEEYKKVLQEERDNLLAVPQDYLKKCAERCWNAEEAFTLEGLNKFNKVIITELLAKIRVDKICPKIETGLIDYTYKNSKHTLDNINGFRWIPKAGKVLILEHPVWSDLYKENMKELKRLALERGEDFEIPKYPMMDNLYVAGIDGIDIGASLTSKLTRDPSDFCIVIKKRAYGLNDPLYVAMYKDRPNNIREAYKIAMCLCKYYNCKINIEATRVGMLTWARENKCLLYFMKRPRATLTDIKYGTSKSYGTPATKTIIALQTDLIADYVEDYGHTIWFEEMLLLLNSYNDENKTKFDIIASLGMVELADLELSGRLPKTLVTEEEEEYCDFGYYIDDYGHKKYGIIPKHNVSLNIEIIKDNDTFRIETSDPRLHEELARSGLYRFN